MIWHMRWEEIKRKKQSRRGIATDYETTRRWSRHWSSGNWQTCLLISTGANPDGLLFYSFHMKAVSSFVYHLLRCSLLLLFYPLPLSVSYFLTYIFCPNIPKCVKLVLYVENRICFLTARIATPALRHLLLPLPINPMPFFIFSFQTEIQPLWSRIKIPPDCFFFSWLAHPQQFLHLMHISLSELFTSGKIIFWSN